MPPMATAAQQHTFTLLAAARTDVCQDMGDKTAIDKYMNDLPAGSRLQGSCCSRMNLTKYVSQIQGLKAYADIPQIPPDPYDVSATSAQQMLGFYNITLTPAEQRVYDSAASRTDDNGWCCCQCWAWYTHAGLAKYLITRHDYSAHQVAAVVNLEDCCGGK